MAKYEFLVDTYSTERLKTLGVWSQIPDARMQFRSEPRARTLAFLNHCAAASHERLTSLSVKSDIAGSKKRRSSLMLLGLGHGSSFAGSRIRLTIVGS